MGFAVDELLEAVSKDSLLGPRLRDQDEYDTLKTLAGSTGEVNWPRVYSASLSSAQKLRDLNAWVWLTRASLVTEGLESFVDGLSLIASGLKKYWDTLPPIDDTAKKPHDRFLGRVSVMGALGMSSYLADRRQIIGTGAANLRLGSDLDFAIMRAKDNPKLRDIASACRAALTGIAETFQYGYDNKPDPQIAFELIFEKMALVEATLNIVSLPGQAGAATNGHARPTGEVASRDDVERVLDLVLDFYSTQELASPVPLLVGRARRLVRMNFIDAMKDLAPGGMRELQVVAGLPGDRA